MKTDPRYQPNKFQRDMAAHAAHLRRLRYEKGMTGHGCTVCPYQAIDQRLPLEERRAQQNEQWTRHMFNMRLAKARKKRERARQNGGV